jgi:hypothetical protein
MNEVVVVTMYKRKVTTNYVRYEPLEAPGMMTCENPLYVSKKAWDEMPEAISVTIRPVP